MVKILMQKYIFDFTPIIMIISVCVGSSCHLKGSYDVIECFKEALASNFVGMGTRNTEFQS